MAGSLQIASEPEVRDTAAAPELPPGLGEIPEYLRDEQLLAERTNLTMSIIAVVFFLLATIGPTAGTYFYLLPQVREAEAARDEADAALSMVASDIKKEEMRNKVREERLVKIEKELVNPTNDRFIDEVIDEIEGLANEVAQGRVEQGSFVTVNGVSVSADRKVSFSGNVDSYLTLAEWIDALEGSPLFDNVPLTSAGITGEGSAQSVPYTFTLPVVLPKAEEKPAETPSSMPAGDPASSMPPASSIPPTLPTATPSSTPSSTPSGVPSAPPTAAPSTTPSGAPSAAPSTPPTATPSSAPSSLPSSLPTTTPSSVPASSTPLPPA